MTTRSPRLSRPRRVVRAPVSSSDGKAAVLTAANAVAGLIDFIGEVVDGADAATAFDRAYRRGKKRARAVARAEGEPLVEED
jgi:hypothetical protein